MRAVEDRAKTWIAKNCLWFAFAVVFGIGLYLRYLLRTVVSLDMLGDYIPWMESLQSGGIAKLFADFTPFPYSAAHVYLWALAAKLFPNMTSITLLKLIVVAFDMAQVAVACLLIWQILPKTRRVTGLFAAFSLLWLDPVLLLNGVAWGQTDVIYLFFSLLTLVFLFRGKPALGMLCFGLALSFKLQAVFLLPAILLLYFCFEKKFSILWYLLVPAVWFAVRVPLQLMNVGFGSAADYLAAQTNSYSAATMNAANLHALLGDAVKSPLLSRDMWEKYSVALTVSVLGGMAVWMIWRKIKLDRQAAVLLCAWSVLTCVFFLPHMHERYGIVGEVLLLLWAVLLWKPRAILYAILSVFSVVSTYCSYLLGREIIDLQLGGVLNLVLILALSWELLRQGREPLHAG